jgi:hypothetical protein
MELCSLDAHTADGRFCVWPVLNLDAGVDCPSIIGTNRCVFSTTLFPPHIRNAPHLGIEWRTDDNDVAQSPRLMVHSKL